MNVMGASNSRPFRRRASAIRSGNMAISTATADWHRLRSFVYWHRVVLSSLTKYGRHHLRGRCSKWKKRGKKTLESSVTNAVRRLLFVPGVITHNFQHRCFFLLRRTYLFPPRSPAVINEKSDCVLMFSPKLIYSQFRPNYGKWMKNRRQSCMWSIRRKNPEFPCAIFNAISFRGN